MPRRVQGPDNKIHEFPDDFSDEEIASALDSLLPPAEAAAKPEPTWSDRLGLNEPTASPVKGFLRGSGAAAVDMAQGAASALLKKANLFAGVEDQGAATAAAMAGKTYAPAEGDEMPIPDTVPAQVGAALPDVAELAIPSGAAIKGIPRAARAAKGFQSVMAAAGDLPVAVTDDVSKAASRIYELSENGATLPSVVRKFFLRATNPERGPLDYRTARDFMSNMGALSAEESARMSPTVRRELIALTRSLGDSVVQTAKQVGKADEYLSAMKEYRQAKKMQEAWTNVKPMIVKPAIVGASGAAGAGAAYEIYRKLRGE